MDAILPELLSAVHRVHQAHPRRSAARLAARAMRETGLHRDAANAEAWDVCFDWARQVAQLLQAGTPAEKLLADPQIAAALREEAEAC
jgi:hypothetical protein